MDASRRRRLAWRRPRGTGPDARLPAVDCLAARPRTRNIGERLSGTGRDSPRWAGARPPGQPRNCDKFDQSPGADELPRDTFESRRTLALSAARWAHGPLD